MIMDFHIADVGMTEILRRSSEVEPRGKGGGIGQLELLSLD